jgi:hypothetical protein
MSVFWDVMPCTLVDTDVSQELTGFTIRVRGQTARSNIPEVVFILVVVRT